MHGLRIHLFIRTETDAMQRQVVHDDLVVLTARAGFGGKPGVAHERLAAATAPVGDGGCSDRAGFHYTGRCGFHALIYSAK